MPTTRHIFEVGVIECEPDKESFLDGANTFFMRFTQEDGLPTIKQYNYIFNDKIIQIIFSKSLIKYKVTDIEPKKND